MCYQVTPNTLQLCRARQFVLWLVRKLDLLQEEHGDRCRK